MALTQSSHRALATSLAASEASSALNLKGFTQGIIEVSGISGDTIVAQGRLSAYGGWYALGVVNVTNATGAVSASIVADGLYRLNLAAIAEIRTDTTRSAGTLNIGIRLSDE